MSQPQQPPKAPETFEQALQLLVDAVQVAQKRGAYSLQESSLVYTSILKIQEELAKPAQAPQQQKIEEI